MTHAYGPSWYRLCDNFGILPCAVGRGVREPGAFAIVYLHLSVGGLVDCVLLFVVDFVSVNLRACALAAGF